MPQLTEDEKAIYRDAAQIAPTDPWYWLRYFSFTKDEHDPLIRFKPFPVKVCYRVLTRALQEFPILFMEKSRQMMISWIYCALFLHDAMFKYNRRIFFQSEKEDKSQALIERCQHLYTGCLNMTGDILGNWLPEPRMVGTKPGTNSQMAFESMGSTIDAIAQGPDQIPSYTLSWLFADEIDLQPKFEKGYGAAAPALNNGGGFLGTGSAYGRTFGYATMYGLDTQTFRSIGDHKIDSRNQKRNFVKPPGHYNKVQERHWIEQTLINMPTEQFMKVPFADLMACVPGIDYWRTRDDFDVIRFHYSSDIAKDPGTEKGKQWCLSLRKIFKTQSAWNQHMEMDRKAYVGRAVVSNWNKLRFMRDLTDEYDPSLPMRLSFDFGVILCGCIMAQYQPIKLIVNEQEKIFWVLKIFREVIQRGSDTPTLAKEVVRVLREEFKPTWMNRNMKGYCDPNGDRRNETTSDKSLNTSIKILKAEGIYCTNKQFGVRESTELIETVFASELPDGQPVILLDNSCTYMESCFDGGLHYPEVGKGTEGHYDKDGEYDHGGDKARYLFGNCFTQYDLTGREQPQYQQPELIHDGHTGRIIAVKGRPIQGHGQYSHRLQGGMSA